MKAVFACLSALLVFAFIALPVDAQTRLIRHPGETGQALAVYVPDGWTDMTDPDNNLIIASPAKGVVFSLSLVPSEPDYTLDEFARAAFDVAEAHSVTSSGEDMIPPYSGSVYTAKMDTNGMALDLRMVIVKSAEDTVASATMIMGPQSTAEEKAVGEMILRSMRIVD
jgi:hypothetical protein